MKNPKSRIIIYLTIVAVVAGFFWWDQQSWQFEVLATDTLAGSRGEYRSVQITHGQRDLKLIVDVVRFPADAYNARLIDLPEYGEDSWQQIIDEHQPKALINGGYFDNDFKPIGHLRIDDVHLGETTDRLSGMLTIDDDRKIILLPVKEAKIEHPFAMQSGPFIIDPGGKMGIRSDDFKEAKRTVMATTESGDVLLIMTSPISLYQLADCMINLPDAFGAESFHAALNLDGGPSSGMFVEMENGRFNKPPDDRTRNVIIFN